MTVFHFPQYKHGLFWKYYDRLHDFLAHCNYFLEKWEILNLVYEGVTCETRALLEHWNFCARMLMKLGNYLSGWLVILMILILVISVLTPHPPASLIICLLHVRYAIILTMTVILIPIIFLLIVLLGLLA